MSTKNSENVTAPTSAIVTFAPESARSRKSRSGRSGERERDSIQTKPATSANAPASSPSVTGEVQPSLAARVSA